MTKRKTLFDDPLTHAIKTGSHTLNETWHHNQMHKESHDMMTKMVAQLSLRALAILLQEYKQDPRLVSAEEYYNTTLEDAGTQLTLNMEEFVHAAESRLNLPHTDFTKLRKFDAAMTGFEKPDNTYREQQFQAQMAAAMASMSRSKMISNATIDNSDTADKSWIDRLKKLIK